MPELTAALNTTGDRQNYADVVNAFRIRITHSTTPAGFSQSLNTNCSSEAAQGLTHPVVFANEREKVIPFWSEN